MKTFIPMHISIRALRRSAVVFLTTAGLITSWAQGGAQTHIWPFDNDANPAPGSAGPAEITVGQGGTGWRDAMSGLPGASGMWDLGKSGQLRVALTTAVVGPAEVTVRINQWYDGWLFNTLPVSIPNAVRLSSMTTMSHATTTSIGMWRIEESVWSVASGVAVTEALVQGTSTGGVVDNVSLTLPVVSVVPLELSIRPLGDGSLEVSWPLAAGMAELQSRGDLGSAEDWEPVTATPQVVGDRYVVTLAPEQSAAFFRLEQ